MSSRLGGGLVVRDEEEGGVATEEDVLTFMHRNRGRSDGDGRMWRALSEEALLPSRFPKRFSIILLIITMIQHFQEALLLKSSGGHSLYPIYRGVLLMSTFVCEFTISNPLLPLSEEVRSS